MKRRLCRCLPTNFKLSPPKLSLICLNTLVNGCIFQLSSHERRRALVRGLSFSNRLILQGQVLIVPPLLFDHQQRLSGPARSCICKFLPPWDLLNFATCWEKEENHLSITSTSKLGNQEYLWIVLQTSGWISIEEINRGKDWNRVVKKLKIQDSGVAPVGRVKERSQVTASTPNTKISIAGHSNWEIPEMLKNKYRKWEIQIGEAVSVRKGGSQVARRLPGPHSLPLSLSGTAKTTNTWNTNTNTELL